MKERVGRARRPGRATACGCRPSTRRARASCAARRRCSATGRRSRSTTRPTPSASSTTCGAISTSTPSASRPAGCTAAISAMKNELVVAGARRVDRAVHPAREARRRRLPRVPAAPARGVGASTSTTCSCSTVRLFREHPDVLAAVARPLPPRARRRVPGHQRRPVGARAACSPKSTATSWSSATPISASSPARASRWATARRRRSKTVRRRRPGPVVLRQRRLPARTAVVAHAPVRSPTAVVAHHHRVRSPHRLAPQTTCTSRVRVGESDEVDRTAARDRPWCCATTGSARRSLAPCLTARSARTSTCVRCRHGGRRRRRASTARPSSTSQCVPVARGCGDAHRCRSCPHRRSGAGMVMVDENGALRRRDRRGAGRARRAPSTTSTSSAPTTSSPRGIVTHNSIYKFRGADFRNLMRFEEVFPEATVDRARAELPLDASASSTPPTRSSPTTRRGGRSTSGPSRSAASSSPATTPRTSTTRPRSSCTRSTGSSTPSGTASATSPSSTGRTRRAASSRSRSCAPACRTASSAA